MTAKDQTYLTQSTVHKGIPMPNKKYIFSRFYLFVKEREGGRERDNTQAGVVAGRERSRPPTEQSA